MGVDAGPNGITAGAKTDQRARRRGVNPQKVEGVKQAQKAQREYGELPHTGPIVHLPDKQSRGLSRCRGTGFPSEAVGRIWLENETGSRRSVSRRIQQV